MEHKGNAKKKSQILSVIRRKLSDHQGIYHRVETYISQPHIKMIINLTGQTKVSNTSQLSIKPVHHTGQKTNQSICLSLTHTMTEPAAGTALV